MLHIVFRIILCYSQQDVGSGAIFGDLNLLFAGIILIVVFVALALGKFNMVHHRVS